MGVSSPRRWLGSGWYLACAQPPPGAGSLPAQSPASPSPPPGAQCQALKVCPVLRDVLQRQSVPCFGADPNTQEEFRSAASRPSLALWRCTSPAPLCGVGEKPALPLAACCLGTDVQLRGRNFYLLPGELLGVQVKAHSAVSAAAES